MEKWYSFNRYDPLKAGSIDGTDTEPHDRGIIRALNAEYYPNRRIKGKAECTIFISHINKHTREDAIKSVFSAYGPIRRCDIIRDIVTGAIKGYGFIEYENISSATNAYKNGNRQVVDGTRIFVDYECERELPGWVPRRLGGGFGGKKESGQLRFGGRARHFKKPLVAKSAEKEGEGDYSYTDSKPSHSDTRSDFRHPYRSHKKTRPADSD